MEVTYIEYIKLFDCAKNEAVQLLNTLLIKRIRTSVFPSTEFRIRGVGGAFHSVPHRGAGGRWDHTAKACPSGQASVAWSLQGMILRPPDYESDALTN